MLVLILLLWPKPNIDFFSLENYTPRKYSYAILTSYKLLKIFITRRNTHKNNPTLVFTITKSP